MEYVHINDEGIRSAANSMRAAAEDMLLAARNIDNSFYSHQRFLQDWLYQFQNVLEQHIEKPAPLDFELDDEIPF